MTVGFSFAKRGAVTSAIYRQVFWLLVGATLAFSPTAVQAQANLTNLQDSLKVITPPLSPTLQLPATEKDGLIDVKSNKCVSKNTPRYKQIEKESLKRANEIVKEEAKKNPGLFIDKIKNFDPSILSRADDLETLNKNPQLFIKMNPHGTADQYTAFITQAVNPNCLTAQPTNLVLSLPLNPTIESNVLKSPTNVNWGPSLGFGGGATLTTAGLEGRPFDLAVYSVSSASARYPTAISKSLDAITEQAAYQVFLDGFYHPGGQEKDFTGKHGEIPPNLPGINQITFDTLTLGFQNQTAFLPGLRRETANLFTPQVTLARSNIALSGVTPKTMCKLGTTPPAPKTSSPPSNPDDALGFCYYLDLSLTAGQTLSDVPTQQNTNFTASVSPGVRIDGTNWKVTLPAVATSRFYNDVVGGRRDVLFQVGPNLSYSAPPTGPGVPFISFSIAATYNQNFSTLATASWRGVIIQPTLTIAFLPELPPK